MKALCSLFTLFLLLVSVPARAQDVPDLSPFVGIYEGLVLNGAGLEPITTTLRMGSGGRLVGDYVIMSRAEGEKPGTISNVFLEAPGIVTLEWTDKDGEGFARLEFAADYRSFVGGWSTYEDSEANNPWSGERQ